MIQIQFEKRIGTGPHRIELDLELTIQKGEFVSILGKSGAGKTTFLRMLAGLVKPDRGFFYCDQSIYFEKDKKICIPPQKREVGLVFQDYALFPHLSVKENLKFGLTKKEDSLYVDELLEMLQLTSHANFNPLSISGGQQQRVALGRALVRRPNLLLMDEPFSAIDEETKSSLKKELKSLQEKLKLTIVMVSHNERECIELSDSIYDLQNGILTKKATIEKEVVGEVLGVEEFQNELYARIYIEGRIIKVKISRDQLNNLLPNFSLSA
jgi:molybdate transport system ATP-binding protein